MPGHPSVAGAHCSLDALELAVGLARSGSAAAVVTGPVSKEQLYAIGFTHPGQTEFVAERCGVVAGQCRDDARRADAADRAGHHPHAASPTSPQRSTTALIEARGRATLRGLQRNFGIAEPRLAVAGLNPACRRRRRARPRGDRDHRAGDRRACAPRAGEVTGPHPADTMFHAARPRAATTRRCACITTRR